MAIFHLKNNPLCEEFQKQTLQQEGEFQMKYQIVPSCQIEMKTLQDINIFFAALKAIHGREGSTYHWQKYQITDYEDCQLEYMQILPHKVKKQYVHFTLHAHYCLLPWKIPEEISRRY